MISSGSDIQKDNVNSVLTYIPVGEVHELDNTDIRQKILDSSTSLYVQGVGKKKIVSDEDKDIEFDISLQKIGEYNKRLRETPDDISLWLDFVKYQDSADVENMTGVEQVSGKNERKLSRRAMLEKKISILDKALEHNPGNIDLLLAKIEVNSEILDSSMINKELERLLFVHPANAKLWKYYLMSNQSRLASFTVSKVTKLYHKAFKTLIGIHTGKLQTHTVPAELEKEILGKCTYQQCTCVCF